MRQDKSWHRRSSRRREQGRPEIKKADRSVAAGGIPGRVGENDSARPASDASAKARVFHNDLHTSDKLVSLFETATQIIPKGKSAKPTEFGRLIKMQEAENQIITDLRSQEAARAKNMVQRIGKTRRYEATPYGLKAMAALRQRAADHTGMMFDQ